MFKFQAMPSSTSCCVPFCVKYGGIKQENITLHSFPQDKELVKLWLEKIQNPTLAINSLNRRPRMPQVCSKHFTPEDFIEAKPDSDGVTPSPILSSDAVPTIFDSPPKRYEMRKRNKKSIDLEDEDSSSSKSETDSKTEQGTGSLATSKVVQIQPKINPSLSNSPGGIQLKPKSDGNGTFTIISSGNLQTSTIKNKLPALKPIQVNLKNHKSIGQVNAPVLVKLVNGSVLQQSKSQNLISIQPNRRKISNGIAIKPANNSTMMKMQSSSQVFLGNHGPVVFTKELHAAPTNLFTSVNSSPVHLIGTSSQSTPPSRSTTSVTATNMPNCSIQLVPLKENPTPKKSSPIVTASERPSNSIEFGRAPRVVAKKFHESYGHHGSLTSCINAALAVAPKLQRKYSFIKPSPLYPDCILVGVPSDRDDLTKLNAELAELDKYVKENHLISRASAIEELLFSDPTPIAQEIHSTEKDDVLKSTTDIKSTKNNSMLKSMLRKQKNNSKYKKSLPSNDDNTETENEDRFGHHCRLCKIAFKTKTLYNRHCQTNQHRMMLKIQRGQLRASSKDNDIKSKVQGPQPSTPTVQKTKRVFKKIYPDSSAIIHRSFSSVVNMKGSKMYKCYFCLQGMSGYADFLKHMWNHCLSHKRCCSWCGIKFKSAGIMRHHIMTVMCANAKIHAVTTTAKQSIRSTSKQVSPIKQLSSSLISRRFTGVIPDHYKPFEVKQQSRQAQWYMCKFCTYIGRELSSIIHHTRQHIADYPFRCSKCMFGSVCKARLMSHQSRTGHSGFFIIRRSEPISMKEIKELELMIENGTLQFNSKGSIDASSRIEAAARVGELPATAFQIEPFISENQTQKPPSIAGTSRGSPASSDGGSDIESTEEDPWMFCKLCNTGFLDRETFREHSQTCSNIGSNSSIWNSSGISTKDECVMIDVDETLDSPEVSPTADRFKDTLAIPQSSNSASLSIPPIKLGKFSNKRTLDNIFQFNVAESTSSIEKTVQSLTLKNQQKLISQDTTKHTTQTVASTVEPCSVGRRSRQKQIPHKRMIITDATPSTSKSVVAFESTKSDDETMDTSS